MVPLTICNNLGKIRKVTLTYLCGIHLVFFYYCVLSCFLGAATGAWRLLGCGALFRELIIAPLLLGLYWYCDCLLPKKDLDGQQNVSLDDHHGRSGMDETCCSHLSCYYESYLWPFVLLGYFLFAEANYLQKVDL